jgi:D-lactate dehydrogenase
MKMSAAVGAGGVDVVHRPVLSAKIITGAEGPMRVTIYDLHPFEKDYLLGANAGRHELRCLSNRLDEETAALAEGSQAVCIFVNDNASAPVLERLAALGVRGLALRCAGYNHVDLERARGLALRVANVPDYSPHAVAEHTVALMLALNRKLVRASNRIRDFNFSLDGLVGFDMHGRTAGIVGLGRIGRLTARILHGFGCRLLGYDPYPDPALGEQYGLEYVSLDDLCRRSDILVLLAPLTEQTWHLIDERAIALMKRGVMLINTSRGGLIKTTAVVEALKTGQIGYLGLDVYEEEQGLFFYDLSDRVLQDDVLARLLSFPNVLITSHQAFLTTTALANISAVTFANLDAWAEGRAPENEL